MDFVAPNYVGGLGNQMFIIANAYVISKKYNKQLVIQRKDYGGVRPSYFHNFFTSLSPYLVDKLPDVQWNTHKEHRDYIYSPIPNLSNLYLSGYYQNPQYILDYHQELRSLFDWDKWEHKVKSTLSIDYTNTCSIHYRLGDYKKLSYFHVVLNDEYYKKALSNVRVDNYLVFCELEDIELVKKRISSYNLSGNIIYVCELHIPDYEEMVLMSLCKVNIIANSSFSWLSAFFNNHKEKSVYYPSSWTNIGYPFDIGCPGWIKI